MRSAGTTEFARDSLATAAMERPCHRVAVLVAAGGITGPGRQLAALACALRPDGIRFDVLILWRVGQPPPPYAAYLEKLGITHHLIEDRGRLDPGILRRTTQVLAEIQPDILETHGYKATAVAWALRRKGVTWPWIGFFHGWTHENLKARFYHWLDHRMLASAQRVVVMSQLQAAGFGRCAQRVRVVHNAVIPMAAAAPADADALARLLAPLPQPRIGVVGRLSPEKGVDVFLHSCAQVHRQGLPFSAVIAGDGPSRDTLLSLRDALGLSDRVAFIGEVRAMAELYGALDLLVIPSRSEGLPNVLLEALAADRPVVATAVGAIPEVLADPAAGQVVQPGSASLLAEAMARALTAGDTAEARLARRRTVERFSVTERAAVHKQLYHETLTAYAR
jgi:glycosyltransferase involved in cell wall biosynthesis